MIATKVWANLAIKLGSPSFYFHRPYASICRKYMVERPKDSLLSEYHGEDRNYQWQEYSFASEALSKEELLELLKSVDITK